MYVNRNIISVLTDITLLGVGPHISVVNTWENDGGDATTQLQISLPRKRGETLLPVKKNTVSNRLLPS